MILFSASLYLLNFAVISFAARNRKHKPGHAAYPKFRGQSLCPARP